MAYQYDNKGFRRRKMYGEKDKETGLVRRGDDAGLRASESPLMVAMYLDAKQYPDTCGSYSAVMRAINARHKEMGVNVEYSYQVVKKEIDSVLEHKRFHDRAEINATWNRADMFFRGVIEDSLRDYEESKCASSRDRGRLLQTLMRDGGLSYEEASAEVDKMRFSGNPDHLRVAMEAYDRRLKMRGVDMSGKAGDGGDSGGGGTSQTATAIVNYNIGALGDGGMDKLKSLAKELQDMKYESIAKDVDPVKEENGNG